MSFSFLSSSQVVGGDPSDKGQDGFPMTNVGNDGRASRVDARVRLGSSTLLRIYFVEWIRMTIGWIPPCQRLQGQAQQLSGMTVSEMNSCCVEMEMLRYN